MKTLAGIAERRISSEVNQAEDGYRREERGVLRFALYRSVQGFAQNDSVAKMSAPTKRAGVPTAPRRR